MYSGFRLMLIARAIAGGYSGGEECYRTMIRVWGQTIWIDLDIIQAQIYLLSDFSDDYYLLYQHNNLLNKDWTSPHQLYAKMKEIVLEEKDIKPKKERHKVKFKF